MILQILKVKSTQNNIIPVPPLKPVFNKDVLVIFRSPFVPPEIPLLKRARFVFKILPHIINATHI